MTMPFEAPFSRQYPSQAHVEAVQAFISALQFDPAKLPCQNGRAELSNAYRQAMMVIWDSLVPWISSVGAQAVLVRAFELSSRSWPFMRLIRLTEAGVDPVSVHRSLEEIDCASATSALQETVLRVLDVLDGIAGDVLVRVVLERVQSATEDFSK
jgi:hypothetical protein